MKTPLLLAEDDPSIAKLLSITLRKLNFEVTWVKNADQGLKEYQKKKFAIGLFDGLLINSNGMDLARAIRQTNKGDQIGLILLTAIFKSGIARRDAYKAGFDIILAKPFTLINVATSIDELLKKYDQQSPEKLHNFIYKKKSRSKTSASKTSGHEKKAPKKKQIKKIQKKSVSHITAPQNTQEIIENLKDTQIPAPIIAKETSSTTGRPRQWNTILHHLTKQRVQALKNEIGVYRSPNNQEAVTEIRKHQNIISYSSEEATQLNTKNQQSQSMMEAVDASQNNIQSIDFLFREEEEKQEPAPLQAYSLLQNQAPLMDVKKASKNFEHNNFTLLLKLFLQTMRQQQTGILTVEQKEASIKIAFLDGVFVGCQHNSEHKQIYQFAIDAKLFEEQDLPRVQTKMQETSMDFLSASIQLQIMTSEAALELLIKYHKSHIYDLLKNKIEKYSFDSTNSRQVGQLFIFPMNLQKLLLLHCLKYSTTEQVSADFKQYSQAKIYRTQDFEQGMHLFQKFKRAQLLPKDIFSEALSLGDIQSKYSVDVQVILWALLQSGIISFSSEQPAAFKIPKTGSIARASQSILEDRKMQQLLEEELYRAAQNNYFDFLHIRPQASVLEIQEVLNEKEYILENLKIECENLESSQKYFSQLKDIYQEISNTLLNSQNRIKYIESLDLVGVKSPEYSLKAEYYLKEETDFNIDEIFEDFEEDSDITLQVNNLLLEGRFAIKNENWRIAYTRFKKLCLLHPQHLENEAFYLYVALKAGESTYENCHEQLMSIHRKDPQIFWSSFFIGEILFEQEDFINAKIWFDKAHFLRPENYECLSRLQTIDEQSNTSLNYRIEENSTQVVMLWCSFSQKHDALKMAKHLVYAKLVACAQLLPQITSIFVWQEELKEEQETILIAKSIKKNQQHIINLIEKKHPYETPELLFTKVTAGLPNYLKWVAENSQFIE